MANRKRRRDKKLAMKIIEALREPAPLNDDKGRYMLDFPRAHSKKDRRHDGRVTPHIIYPKMKWVDIIKDALEPMVFWDDWIEYRDGFRSITWVSEEDKKNNKEKIKKQTKIREARKQKGLNTKPTY